MRALLYPVNPWLAITWALKTSLVAVATSILAATPRLYFLLTSDSNVVLMVRDSLAIL